MKKIKIFDKNGTLIGWKVPVDKNYIEKRKNELSNIFIKLKGTKNKI